MSSAHSASEERTNEWTSQVYGFFEKPKLVQTDDNRMAHEFKCAKPGCMARIRRYLDTKDAKSTGNLRKHVKSCRSEEVLQAADSVANADDVRQKIIPNILKNGTITDAFKIKTRGKGTYSHRPHTREQTK
jgi:hypothetical protein